MCPGCSTALVAQEPFELCGQLVARGQAAFSQATHLLSVLARETGGQAFFPAQLQELDSVYDRIAEEMRTQYSMGYVPTNQKRDGKYRRIVVRVPSRENVVLRYKLGYVGPTA